jgi:hypothetical protein
LNTWLLLAVEAGVVDEALVAAREDTARIRDFL